MKNTPRIHANNNANVTKTKGKKTTILGQNAATIGHKNFDTKGKVTIGALRIGEAIGLSESEIKALALLADWWGKTPEECCREACQGYMQSIVDQAEIEARDGKTPKEKAQASKFLSSLPRIFHGVSNKPDAIAPGAIPQALVAEVKSALGELDRASQAVATLLMMIADNLHENMRAYEPQGRDSGAWKQFADFNSEATALDLAIKQIIQLREQFDCWRNGQLSMIEGQNPSENSFECEVLQICALLRLQADTFGGRFRINDGNSPSLLASSVAARLWSAYEKSLHLGFALIRTIENAGSLRNVKQAA
jgi:hypothetical protein